MPGMLKQTLNKAIIRIGSRIERKRFNGMPIIIGACPRSGTTILLSILGALQNIFAIPNQTYAFDEWQEMKISAGTKIIPSRIDRLYREFIKNRIPGEANRWCEKTPKHVQSFGKILNYFNDEVKLVHIVRDGRDVITSKHPKHSPDQYWVSMERWINDVNCGLKYRDHQSVFTLRYEDLILKYQESMADVCQFLDEPFTEELSSWLQYTNIKKSKHLSRPVEDLYRESIGRWRHPDHSRRIEALNAREDAVSMLKELDYSI